MLTLRLANFGAASHIDKLLNVIRQGETTSRAKFSGAIRTIGTAILFVGGSMAHAGTVTVHSVFDLSQRNLAGGIAALGTTPDTAFFKQGDTVVLDIDFLGNQTLKFDSISGISGAVLNTTNDCPHSTSSLSLHDYSGSGQGTISSGQYQGCATQLGAYFWQGAPGFPSGAIEFSGVTFTFANVNLSDSALRSASGGRLDIGGQNGRMGSLDVAPPAPGSVPEPSDLALVTIGLGMLGVTLRRRRKQ